MQEAIEDAYGVAPSSAAAEAFGGSYAISQLAAMVDRTKSLGENHPNTQTAWGNFRHLLQ